MYTVLIGVDDDEERARSCAQAVADLPGDAAEKSVTVIHSFTNNPSGASATQVRSVREVSEFFDEQGIEYEVAESSGDPTEQILDTAEEIGANLIVLAGRKRSPAGKVLFGSVTQSVILNADIPVMVAGEVKETAEVRETTD
ncbi:universal stress protein [Haloplanus sp. GCM10025708]|uniref:universal stress protein n=1 Tax=Haloferacaceae TaxID=1644056 RepID=UPI00361A1D5A